MLYGLSPLLEGIVSRRVVFVLGAGASKDCGLPLYRELLDPSYLNEIRAYLDGLGLTTERRDSFEVLIESAESRMQAFSDYGTDVEQLLERFSLSDHCLYDQLIDHYYTLLRAADTIYHCHRLPYTIERLPQFLYALQCGGSALSFISFNHDLIFEYGMQDAKELRGLHFSYGLKRGAFTPLEQVIHKTYRNVSPPCEYDETALLRPKTIPFIKLHGSFNWAICGACEHLVVFGDDLGTRVAPTFVNEVWKCPKCNSGLRLSVIPPKKTKTILDVAGVWTTARRILRESDTVVFAGYSLPYYDGDALDLFTDAITRRTRLEIVNPRASEMFTHFSLIFPENEIIPIPMGFLDYLIECSTLRK